MLETFESEVGLNSYEILVQKLEEISPEAMLDLGCGEGAIRKYFKDQLLAIPYLGVDISLNAIQIANERYHSKNVQFIECSSDKISAKSSEFDIVFANMVLHLIGPIKETLTEVKRVLRPGGHFLIYTPAPWRSAEDPMTMLFAEIVDLLKSNSPRRASIGAWNGVMENIELITTAIQDVFGSSVLVQEEKTDFFYSGPAIEVLQPFTLGMADFYLVPKSEKARVLQLLFDRLLMNSDENSQVTVRRPMSLLSIRKSND
jgi:ubiquinone/menaquinone biosynthesis C-methylase UbiE